MKADYEKRIADLERQVRILTDAIAPPVNDVHAEVKHLVSIHGLDKAAEIINKRNALRTAI